MVFLFEVLQESCPKDHFLMLLFFDFLFWGAAKEYDLFVVKRSNSKGLCAIIFF